MFKSIKLISFSLLILLGLTNVVYSQLPFTENFDAYPIPFGIEGAGAVNVGGYPAAHPWTIDVSAASLTAALDYGYVNGAVGAGYFEVRDSDGPVVWLSSAIDINGCSNVSFSIDLAEIGNMEASDYIHIEYSTDNGATFTGIFNWAGLGSATRTVNNDFGTTTVTQTGLTGTFLVLRVSFNCNNGAERLRMDNINITGTGCPGAVVINNLGYTVVPPFNANCAAGTGTNSQVVFSTTGTFNAGNNFIVQLSDDIGTFISPTVIGTLSGVAAEGVNPGGSIPISIPSSSTTSGSYVIRIISTDYIGLSSTSTPFTITQTNPCSITTGAVATTPFAVNCTTSTTATGTVAFTSTGTFNAGNVYTVELSDATGSFATPLSIGTLTSTANSGSIPITIPFTVNTGAAYVVRVISSDPAMIGSTSAAFTITQMAQCLPTIPNTSGLIINEFSNGPSGTAQEYYEFVVAGECGNLVDIRGFILDDNNGTFTTPPVTTISGSGVAKGHFRFSAAAQWASIPVGSLIVIYNDCDRNPALPADDLTDANNDSLYVVPHTSTLFERCTTRPAAPADSTYTPCGYSTASAACPNKTGSWGPLGLRNQGDAIQVRNPNGSYFHGISYGNSSISGGPDNTKLFTGNGGGRVGWFTTGDFRDIGQWSSGPTAGNQTPGLPNNAANLLWLRAMRDTVSANCPLVILPVELSSFSGRNINEGNLIMWSTDSERDASHFIIERSIDGKNWEIVNYEDASGNSNNTLNYSFIDQDYEKKINYYRLNQIDINGVNTIYNRFVRIDNSKLSNTNVVRIINILGQDIDANESGIQIHIFEDGTSKKVYHN